MVTKTTKKVRKKAVTKKVNTDFKRIEFTRKQVETIANFYTKNNKKLPAFLAKKLA